MPSEYNVEKKPFCLKSNTREVTLKGRVGFTFNKERQRITNFILNNSHRRMLKEISAWGRFNCSKNVYFSPSSLCEFKDFWAIHYRSAKLSLNSEGSAYQYDLIQLLHKKFIPCSEWSLFFNVCMYKRVNFLAAFCFKN